MSKPFKRLALAVVAALTITAAQAQTRAEMLDTRIYGFAVDYAMAARTATLCGLAFPIEYDRKMRSLIMNNEPLLIAKLVRYGNEQDEIQAKAMTTCTDLGAKLYLSSVTKLRADLESFELWLKQSKG